MHSRALFLAALFLAATRAFSGPAPAPFASPAVVSLAGRVVLADDLTFEGVRIGGLSALQFDPKSGSFWALSDDRAQHGPVRAYRFRLQMSNPNGTPREKPLVEIEGTLALSDAKGRPYETGSIDPEGWAAAPDGGWFLSTEPILDRNVPPIIAKLSPAGRLEKQLELPAHFLPAPGRGVRHNLGFEALGLSPDGRWLFAAVENALAQDGPVSSQGQASPCRVLRFDLVKGGRPAEFVYTVEPVSAKPPRERGFQLNGLSDILVLDQNRVLVLERQFVEGVGNQALVWEASFDTATEVSSLDSLSSTTWVPARKSILLDLAGTGVPLENFEGMTFGPELPDGRRTLVIVSDDNFNDSQERTTFLVYALDLSPVAISRVQGSRHQSPLVGSWLRALPGVITGIDRDGRFPGFWMESATPDGDPYTSEGIFVSWPGAASLTVGTPVSVNGQVEEFAQPRGLSVTRIRGVAVSASGAAASLPPPVKLFSEVSIPKVISSEAFSRFDPASFAIDLWESLEGMRVEIPAGTAIGPALSRGEVFYRPDGLAPIQNSRFGGLRLTSPLPPLEKVSLAPRAAGPPPKVDVGARLKGPITGIVDYSGSIFKIQVLAPLTVEKESPATPAVTSLAKDRKHLTMATFNVENFSVAGPADKAARLAESIAKKLLSPDILSLEEVQDDSGPAKGDGVVTSAKTLGALIDAIVAAGGPRYEAAWIDPIEGKEGGQPGGNIRLAFLWNPERVELVKRGTAGPLDATEPRGKGKKLELSLSPGRVAPSSSAFTLAEGEGVRRSLAAEFKFFGKTVFVVGNHWSSKTDDDKLFGNVQPPKTPTAARRMEQAREIRTFLEKLLAADPKARVVALGDLNDLEFTESVRHLSREPFENLILKVPEADRYTFNFEGMSQVLDHVVVSPELSRGAEIEVAHINADFAFTKRTSDHDPVVVRFEIR